MSDEQRAASLLLRAAAKLLDFIIIAAVVELVPRAGYFAGLAYLLLGDGFLVGQSLGKKLIHLQVCSKESKEPCTYKESIVRNSTLAVGYILWKIPWIGWMFMICAIGLECILIIGSKEGMRLGDELAHTIVVEAGPEGNKGE